MESVFRLTARLQKTQGLMFLNWDSMVLDWESLFFTRWVPGLIINHNYLYQNHCIMQCSRLPDGGIAALPHFFGKCHTIISPRDFKGTKKGKKHIKYKAYVNIRSFPYNISQNIIGYSLFKKHSSLSKKLWGIHSNSDLWKHWINCI